MSYRGRGRGGYYNNNNNNNNGHNGMNQDGFSMGHHRSNNGNHSTVNGGMINSMTNNGPHSNQVQVEVWGWNNATPAELVAFISRKTRIGLLNHSVNEMNGALVGFVRSQKDADSLMNWNGVKFAGQSLKFNILNRADSSIPRSLSGLSSATISTMESLKEFLKLRYNPAMKMLDLSNMQNDQLLVSRGLLGSSTTSSTSSKMFIALMKLLTQDASIVVETVNLLNNSLNDTFNSLSLLGTTFPKLINLSLESNRISRVKFFETWKNKFSNLRELVLLNNPVQQSTNYQFEMLKIFPRLILLDGQILRDELKLKSIFNFPVQTQQMFLETLEVQNIATSFVANYLKLWDSNRQELLGLYSSPESQFSIQVDSSHPAHFHEDNAQFWSYYMPNSRNLSRISNERSRVTRLHKGSESIYKVFQQIPKTKHLLLESPHLFSMESYSYPQINGIIVTLHGEFEEVAIPDVVPAPSGPRNYQNRYHNQLKGTLAKRSFDRTFVVVQGANQAMIIASDMLLVRPHAGENAWIASPLSSNATPSPATPVPTGTNPTAASVTPSSNTFAVLQQQVPPEVLNSLNANQQQLLAKVFEETKLNAEFSLMLCQQSNWDYQTCLTSFNSSKGNIPLNAYQQ